MLAKVHVSREKINTRTKCTYHIFAIKRDGASPVLPEESELNIPEFIQGRSSNLPDPNKLIVPVHAFFIQKVNQVSSG